jgi:chitodextrinase
MHTCFARIALQQQSLRVSILTFAAFFLQFWSPPVPVLAQTFSDPGLASELVTTLAPSTPIGLAWAPDGRMFIWTKNGVVRVFKNGVLLPTPFIDLSGSVNTFGDRGMWGLAFSPGFETDSYVYLGYVYEEGRTVGDSTPRTSRVIRVTADPRNPDVALARSEVVIAAGIAGGDSRDIGPLRFAPDGKLVVGKDTEVPAPLSELGPDGNIYYVSFTTGEIRRLRYNGPAAAISATLTSGHSPLLVAFSSTGSIDPTGNALTYLWDFGDGTTSTAANPSHTYTSRSVATFVARLTVKTTTNKTASATIPITLGSHVPAATILAPVDRSAAVRGRDIFFQGSGSDADDGPLPPAALSWKVLLHRGGSVRTILTTDGSASGSFRAEDGGAGSYSYEIILKVTDSSGLTATASVSLPVSVDSPPPIRSIPSPDMLTSTVTESVDSSPPYGLEWPGDGAVRRMLYWHNPFPIYDATYIFKVFPRKKTTGTYRYYTTFFWGNDGTFLWDGGLPNTYYGAHPYPIPAPGGAGQWEISVGSNDFVTGSEVQWDRWYTQAFRAWRESPSITHHEFYWDLPDTSKVISHTVVDPNWADGNPPTPAIYVGQAAWGAYQGDEEFKGIIRGIQMYSGLLSTADIQAEIAAPKSTLAGQNLIWYLNLNPRPGDVTDKKEAGIPHDPLWRGTTALEWTDPTFLDTTPPSTPTNLTATTMSSSQINVSWTASTDNVGVTGYMVERCEAVGCATFTQIATPAGTTYSDSGLVAATSYSYQVRARDAAGNLSVFSDTGSATTDLPPPPDTVPPTTPLNLSATAVSMSQINVGWTASTDDVGVTGYLLERCQGSGCSAFTQIATTSVPSHNDAGLAMGASYSYRARATDAAGNISDYSNVASGTTFTTPPPAAAFAFDEGAGLTTVDASGNGFTGTLTNGPVWTAGKYAQALSFDGVDDKVSLPGTLDIPALPFTIEAWVRPTNFSNWRVIFSKRSSYSASGMRIDMGLQTSSGRVYVGSFSSSVVFTYAPPVNTWTHLAVTADATGTRLYVNSVLQQTLGVITLGSNATAAVNIGRTNDNQDPFAGSIDDLRVYLRALSQTEVQTDMNTAVVNGPPDTDAPSMPAALNATAAGMSQINLSWTASTDNVGVTGYRVERCVGTGCSNFAQIATPAGNSYNDAGLATATEYSYRVFARDGAGNWSAPSNVATATTLADTTAPIISAVSATNITTTGATIVWTTNEAANSQVLYGLDTGYSQATTLNPSLVTSHGETLTGLQPGTLYHYSVASADGSANTASSADFTFTTVTPDVTPPVISAVNATAITVAGATITWTTNEPSDTQVNYGLTTSYGSATPLNPAAVTSHSQPITGLQPNTTYHYQVLSKDASGNAAASSDATFTTPADPDPGVPSSGLVSRWKFSAGSGTVAADATGSNPATLTGFACTTLDCNATSGWASAGKFGKAINMDGSNDVVNAGTGASLNDLASFTYSVWIYPRSNGEGNAGRIVDKAGGSGFKRLRLNNSPSASFYGQVKLSTTNAVATSAANAVTLNQWQHVAMTFDASTRILKIYKNGVQVASGTGTGTPVSEASGAFVIGNTAGGTNTFNGLIDDVLLYNRALSQTEIQTLASGAPDAGPPVISAVNATNVTQTSATITWSTDELADTRVEYGTTASYGSSTTLDAALVTAHSIGLSGLSVSTTYHYRVHSRDSSGNVSQSADFTFTTVTPDTTPPAAPSGLTASAVSSSQINLSWTASTDDIGVTGYLLERCQGAGCSNFAQIATPSGTTYNNTGLSASTAYSYRVRATDGAGNLSAYSNVAGGTTPAAPPATGLVAAYAFAEGSGTTVTDFSGNGNTGTISGATWTTQGKYGNALSFDGVNDLVVINGSASLNVSSAMTLEAWIYPAASQSGWRTILQKQVDAYFLNASHSGGPLRPAGGATINSSVRYVGASSASPVNTWTHVALTFNGSTLQLYVNGSPVASQSTSGTIQTTSNALRIGGNVPYGEYFNGRIDEVRVYNRALTQAEIQADMNTPMN